MQRRRFMQTVTTASAAAQVASAQQSPRPQVSAEPVKIATVPADAAAETSQSFFTATQFATLRRLCELLQPAVNGRPGAIEAGAPEFLDFLIGASLPPRQQLYQYGLDYVDAEARRQFAKPFAAITDDQAEKVLRPLLAPWTYDPPTDSRQHFLTELRADVRTATMNSKEMSQVAAATPRRGRGRGPGGGGLYWLPIDPTR